MRYSSGYLWLLNLNARYRYIYTLLAAAALSLVWLCFVYLPTEKRLGQTGQEIQQLKKDGSLCVEQQASCKKLTDDLTQLQKDVSGLCEASSSVSQYFSLLMQHTQDAGMRLVSLRATEQKEHGWYVSAHAVFEALGTLPAVMQFFKLLADRQELVQCDEMSLQRQADDTFLLHCVLRLVLPKSAESVEMKSPSTLKKS